MSQKAYTADQLNKKIDEFIQLCEDGTIAEPTDYELMRYLGVSPRTLSRYRADEHDKTREYKTEAYKGTGDALKKLDIYREHRLMCEVRADPRLAGHVAFALKQPHWGGWSDRQQVDNKQIVELTVKLPDEQ